MSVEKNIRTVALAFKKGQEAQAGDLSTNGEVVRHDSYMIIKRLAPERYMIRLGENLPSRRDRINGVCRLCRIPYSVWTQESEPMASWVDDTGERWTYKVLPCDEVFASVAPTGATKDTFLNNLKKSLKTQAYQNLENLEGIAANRNDKEALMLIRAEMRDRKEKGLV